MPIQVTIFLSGTGITNRNLIPHVDLFSFVSWKNWGYQKVLLKLNDREEWLSDFSKPAAKVYSESAIWLADFRNIKTFESIIKFGNLITMYIHW